MSELNDNLRREMMRCVSPFKDAVDAMTGRSSMKNFAGRSFGNANNLIFGYVSYVFSENETIDLVDSEGNTYKKNVYGAVSVQEYDRDGDDGFHEVVWVSPILESHTGMMCLPSLYSDVIISNAMHPYDADNGIVCFVVMASHVDLIQVKSHTNTMVGVVELEEKKDGEEDESTWEEKSETGLSATTQYTKESIDHEVKDTSDSCKISHTVEGIIVEAKDSQITISNDGTISVKGKKITIEADDAAIKSKSIKHNEGSQKMVLGDKLVAHLKSLCSAISSMTINTPHGIGTVTNPSAFTSISKQLSNDLSTKSFLD